MTPDPQQTDKQGDQDDSQVRIRSATTANSSDAPEAAIDPPAESGEAESALAPDSVAYWLRPETPEAVRDRARLAEKGLEPDRFVAANYRGQLPGAADLAKYEETVPGMADRLMSLVEADHRARVRAIDSRHSAAIWRILSSSLTTALALLVAGFCFFMEERVSGCIVAAVSFGCLAFNTYCDSRVIASDELT